ncbi:hypothetical protein [Sphingomonas faeni]|uniref:hypothetical protein n=1 Tax=Sphingomonas faeni TaxID=185950 RepID=UPI00334DB631
MFDTFGGTRENANDGTALLKLLFTMGKSILPNAFVGVESFAPNRLQNNIKRGWQAMAIGSGVLEVWINAFIPRVVGTYTKAIMIGDHAGKTAVPLPNLARAWPGNWGHDWDSGFLTDQRDFSSNRSASVRMQSSADITVSPFGMLFKKAPARTSGTIGVNVKTGEEKGRSDARLQKCRMFIPKVVAMPSRQRVQSDEEVMLIEVYGAASDPLVDFSADIDYRGHFQVIRKKDNSSLAINFYGAIDAFPAFESYARWKGQTKEIFKSSPPKGNTVVNLLGPPNRLIQGSAYFR